MKKVLGVIAIIFFFFSCERNIENKEVISACGINEPQKNIEWLSKLIDKAKNDKTGNYMGTIWLEKYKGNDIFITNMSMGSGAIAFYFFDCQGNSFVPESFSEIKFNTVIYTNVPN
ncbi:MAG: hypothetical protein VB075_11055 [Petrimonas sp.]|uniref:hypothetical protein n=1 Tax=Petrimonas sp. TaxID=2023866 RepID=UPI000961770F|nr:hypothetical protein [Petrimonas sp.]MEA4978564.1 hypothetical protein [Petrimonas sp.]MEA5045090.1 hypothetical protein [Petrimonas sp.]OJV35147.1 MAG: hypothetical protein BGO33_12115 [Bacteroidia bacterium 43-41]